MQNKRLTKARAILKGARGETLMEGIISILIFTILLTSVTMMIMVSLRITANATARAETMQNNANAAAVLTGSRDREIRFSIIEIDGVTVDIALPDVNVEIASGDFIAFTP